jgi:hypothetical protein
MLAFLLPQSFDLFLFFPPAITTILSTMKLVFFALLLSCAVALVAAQWSVTDQEVS